MSQGEIIAAAIAASATVDSDAISVDPGPKLLELQGDGDEPGAALRPRSDSLDFPINPERVAPLLRRLITPTRTRARIYDKRRDAAAGFAQSLLAWPHPPATICRRIDESDEPALARSGRGTCCVYGFFQRKDLPLYREQPGGNGAAYPEVVNALIGSPGFIVRISEQGDMIVSVAVPVQRFRAVLGVLLLSTQGGDIDKIVADERKAIFRVFGVAALVTATLSLLLASTIANPLRRLSAAAVRVRRGVRSREEIPDFSRPPGRDRQPLGRAPRHDQRALRPHRCHRELRRRRLARAEESADLAAQRGRDPAARPQTRPIASACSRSSCTTCTASTG
jgi:two-component system sensor histidine kinase ChvG